MVTSQRINAQKTNANLRNSIIVPKRYAKTVKGELPQEKVNAEEGYFAVIHDLLI